MPNEPLTLRKLLDRLTKRGDNLEEVMDYQLAVGVRDLAGNFESYVVPDCWPCTFRPHGGFQGQLRLDVCLDRYMRKAKGQS